MNRLLTLSATELAKLIREREVTSVEVVEAHIERIRSANPTLNAVVAERFQDARAEAVAADAQVRAGADALGPFHGVPCTIKESFSMRGMPHTAGLVSRKGVIGTTDAPTVARLKAAGAIPLGVTNVSELCFWIESNNRVYGRTNNPYNPRRTAGGSSGGEGAIVGAGGSPFGLASDVGGSIRMPAFFNGVFGHKPSGGMVPVSGQFPVPEAQGAPFLATGPIARHAVDLYPLLKTIAGPDAGDLSCEEFDLKDPSTVNLRGLEVVDVTDNGVFPISAELRAAQRRCADYLEAQGARVRRVKVDGLKRSIDIWSSMITETTGTTFRSLLENGQPIDLPSEFVTWARRRSPHTLPSLAVVCLERLSRYDSNRNQRVVSLGNALREELTDLIGPNGVMLFPSYANAAPLHAAPLLIPIYIAYPAIFNVMQFPVTQVPLGLNASGLPLGVQVASIRGNDHLSIAVAIELERSMGGWVPPWTVQRAPEQGSARKAFERSYSSGSRLWQAARNKRNAFFAD